MKKIFLMSILLIGAGYIGLKESYKRGQISACKMVYVNLYEKMGLKEINQDSLNNFCIETFNEPKN